MTNRTLLIGLFLALPPSHSFAQAELLQLDEQEQHRVKSPSNISAEFLDPAGRSRFHLVTRMTFDDGDKLFSSSSAWAFEAKVAIQVTEGFAITGVLPFGLEAANQSPNNFFIGNIRLGVAGGTYFSLNAKPGQTDGPRLGVGGAIDVYLPTTPGFDGDDCGLRPFCDPTLILRLMRAYEPELYIPEAMAFKARAHVDLQLGIFTAAAELGFAPAFTVTNNSQFIGILNVGGRVSVRALPSVEPFASIASSVEAIADEGEDLGLPALLTTGVRFHFSSLSPAIFAIFNLDQSHVSFGIDIAGAIPEFTRGHNKDFLNDGFGDF